jgi:hypothetical protein
MSVQALFISPTKCFGFRFHPLQQALIIAVLVLLDLVGAFSYQLICELPESLPHRNPLPHRRVHPPSRHQPSRLDEPRVRVRFPSSRFSIATWACSNIGTLSSYSSALEFVLLISARQRVLSAIQTAGSYTRLGLHCRSSCNIIISSPLFCICEATISTSSCPIYRCYLST